MEILEHSMCVVLEMYALLEHYKNYFKTNRQTIYQTHIRVMKLRYSDKTVSLAAILLLRLLAKPLMQTSLACVR